MTGDQKRRLQQKAEDCYHSAKYSIEKHPGYWDRDMVADMLECGKCPWCDVCDIPKDVIKEKPEGMEEEYDVT